MRWKRGSRAFLRLPCAWLLLLLPLTAAAGLGEEVAETPGRHHGTFAELPSASRVAGDSRPYESGEDAAGRGRSSEEEQSRVSRNGRRLDEDEESRILWRGWLLVDEAPTRRKAHITPKSVFIAPVIRGEGNRGGGGGIPACAEGYRSDAMGRCHKVVRVNQEAHLNFLLQRLNALYREPSPPAPASSSSQGDAGPLLVTIPLATNPPQNEDSEEEGDDVDLVVVVEAGMPKDAPGSLKDRLGLFADKQVVAESQEEDVVVQGDTGALPANSEEDKLMPASATDLEKNTSSAIGSVVDSLEPNGGQAVSAQLHAHSELNIEPVIHTEASNSTEDSNVRREISGSGNPERASNENPNDSSKETSAFTATKTKMNETNADGATDVNLANSHIYETTVISKYSTTESNGGKVTELPEVLHKQNLEPVPNGNISDHKIEEVVGESQKRVVFPGRVEERVRFPDMEERRPLYPLYPSTTASSETQSSTPSQPLKSTSRPWGAWNRPMLLKFWTQMPLVREPTHGPDSVAKGVLPTTSDEDTSSFAKQEESWAIPARSDTQSKVHHGGPYQRRPWIYYQEMSPRDLASVSRVFDRVRHFESRG